MLPSRNTLTPLLTPSPVQAFPSWHLGTKANPDLCLALSALSWPSCALRSLYSPASYQVRACLGVLSTQVVFNEPADFSILHLTRCRFGPRSPAVLAGEFASVVTNALNSWRGGGRKNYQEQEGGAKRDDGYVQISVLTVLFFFFLNYL